MNYLASSGQLRASLLRWSLFTVPLLLVLGFFSGQAAGSGPGNPWFDELVKPTIYPPPVAFPIVWSTLYVLMGISLAMILSARGAAGRGLAVAVFVVQLALNLAWSPVFFAMHQILAAFWIAVAMAVTILLTLVLFWRIRPVAGMLLLPYLAWVCFASVLTFEIGRLNPGADGAFGSSRTVRVSI
ncbi:TspO and MBR like protein [Novosphingobium aromaticivorans DSM 12444]|uniref:TspO and MBR like protein n=1 Tax=Novosphingobium aromaticivorans (strain ATCC 700278 / DSM 12444 / CCUG 56034 / CIP 105152 / NBRC 16084 / F199) TaxID=279238 RepID=Q2G4W9_NOVAD|nr:TspO/MBR family protein [Novosphingobium aromaticivorans]ABD27104.1 TspO and MBR like protein [Novosphingobium aromaticivorans DSM 12444]